jgi:hypothetical protein
MVDESLPTPASCLAPLPSGTYAPAPEPVRSEAGYGTKAVASATPDGYTLLFIRDNLGLNAVSKSRF